MLQPELGTRPRIYYKNMHLFTQCFVGGSVVAMVNGVEECAEGAEVVVSQDGKEVGRASTDLFGEFKVDRLAPGSGSYQLAVSGTAGQASLTFEMQDESLYLGAISLAVAA